MVKVAARGKQHRQGGTRCPAELINLRAAGPPYLEERGHISASTPDLVSRALLGPFFPRPWTLTVQCSHCTQLALCPAPLFPGLKRGFTAARTSCGNLQETRWFLSGHACPVCCIKLLDISVFPRTTDQMQRLFATRL